jgi:cytochrome c peroxidase
MKKAYLLFGILAAISIVVACSKKKDTVSLNQTEVVASPVLPANRDIYYIDSASTNNIATLGRVLFYDKHLSLNNSVSCASCHKQEYAFADNKAFSLGYENRATRRSSPSIENLGGGDLKIPRVTTSQLLFWDGRENIINNLIARPITNHVEMGISDFSQLSDKLKDLPYYKDLFIRAFGNNDVNIDRISLAITYFICAIKASHTRFDDANAGNITFTALELEGQQLFTSKYHCASCHHTDPNGYAMGATIANIGLDKISVDPGAGAIDGKSANGAFKVPNLRNVALTAPYMHDGRFKTLDEVLNFYSHGIQEVSGLNSILRDQNTGKPLQMNISDQEKEALKAFLNTLTDYTMITDPKFSDPFQITN